MQKDRIEGVILDFASLAPADLDLTSLEASLPVWRRYDTTAAVDTALRLQGATVALTNKVVIGEPELAANPQLRLIAVMATGTNNVDLEAARRRGVTVCNAVGYSTPSVVQHCFAMMLALASRTPHYDAAVRAGEWVRSPMFCLLDYPTEELAGKTLGILGYGAIGRAVGMVAQAFGMTVLPLQRPGTAAETGRMPLDKALPQLDVLSLHCALSEQTRGLINAERLARLPPGALLINCARGGIVDEHALAGALRSGHLGGAGVDVMAVEPPPADAPLLDPALPNLILTPHTAWASRQARQRLVGQMVAVIEGFLSGQPSNRVA